MCTLDQEKVLLVSSPWLSFLLSKTLSFETQRRTFISNFLQNTSTQKSNKYLNQFCSSQVQNSENINRLLITVFRKIKAYQNQFGSHRDNGYAAQQSCCPLYEILDVVQENVLRSTMLNPLYPLISSLQLVRCDFFLSHSLSQYHTYQ